jgi:hypothetical protein
MTDQEKGCPFDEPIYNPSIKPPVPPVHGEIAIVHLPVRVVFLWSDKIVEEVDENNNPVEYRSGFIMQHLSENTWVYDNQPRITEAYGLFKDIRFDNIQE